ncbi:MAG: YbaB/EbfC family nucleoid-associated protein [Verrucomicrobiota bacterium]
MNPMKLMKQAQKMQAEAQKMENELANKRFEASAGGGAIKVVVDGKSHLRDVVIDPEILKEGDAEMLQDFILTAYRESSEMAVKDQEAQMKKLTAGMQLPPGMGF